ncbi:MAG: 1-acyl-sn-glycerol-3-phosphate acyltransferase, partial [Alphaproteobacteria bacterium]|nr:1-acyl-sn-glycerol-3-phosphate acyltransferase [Alphaproteobacteria bacterium]
KRDVAGWPGIGMLARVVGTLFIERNRRRAALHRDVIAERLAEGRSLILFPEGTSSDGSAVLPFKSTLFAVAECRPDVAVRPVSIVYTGINGRPMEPAWRPLVAWYGDMTLGPHLWAFLGLEGVSVEVTFHPPVRSAPGLTRKDLARLCHEAVAGAVGRRITTPPEQGWKETDR